jgi:phosphotransferase system  glucose/maltose/N-acetylglucosamine-specific IIC component
MKDIPTTDADRLQKYALWWIAITAILAAILFIVKGIKNRKKSLENQSKMGDQKPKEMYKKYKNTNKKKSKRKK